MRTLVVVVVAAAWWLAVAGCGGGASGGMPPKGHPGDKVKPAISPDVDGRITINEFMAANVLTARDATGGAGNWVELFNPTDQDIPLTGYGLTDDLAAPDKVVIAAPGPIVPAGGHLVLWFDGNAAAGPDHVALGLDRAGGAIGLARPDGSFIDRVTYLQQAVDLSASREPDGSDRWVIEWHASPGAANPASPASPSDAETVPGAGDLSERILGYDVVPRFELQLGPDALASLQASPRVDAPAMLVYDGRSYGPVAVHLKGMQSFETIDKKPSWRIGVDGFVNGAEFFGLKDMTLNNMHSDPSMMHERIAYWVARQVGVPASRANHAMVTVNGALYGLYANVETIKKRMLARWFPDSTGSLYEATDVDFVASYLPLYSLESGMDDRSLIGGVDGALAAGAPPDAAIAAAGAYIDMAEFKRYWAFCAVVGQLDSFPYSVPGDDVFFYADPQSARLKSIPWGIDESFLALDYDVTKVTSVLARTCQASPACYQDFVDETWQILAMVEAIAWTAEHDRVAAQIAPLTGMDTRKAYPDTDVTKFQSAFRSFMSSRHAALQGWLPAAR